MNTNAYKVLGFVVWQGGKWYARRKYGRLLPSRRTLAIAAAAATAAVGVGAVALGARGSEA